jgi:uncharacterized repeat protein (TIGR01451 family)
MSVARLLAATTAAVLLASTLSAQTVSVSVALQRPDPGPAVAGTQLVFNIFANNEGPADANNVVVDTAVPSGSTFVSLSAPAGWSCPTLPPPGGTGAIQCTTPTLVPSSDTLVLTIETPPSTPEGTQLQLDATISTTSNDPHLDDNHDTLTVPIVWQVNLSIAKNAPATAASGAVITYTIPVTNPGPSFAANLTVTDVLPPELTFVSASGPGWTCGNASGTVTCTLPQLALTTSTITLQASTLPSFAGGTVTNGVSLTSTSDASTRTASASTQVAPRADLGITKSAAPSSPVAGQDLVYTIVVTNNGPSDAASVVLTDALPPQVTFVSIAPPPGWSCSGTTTITCSIAALAPATPQQFTLTTHVPPATPLGTTISNTATVSSATPDPTTPNSATASGSTTTPADVALVSIADTPDPVLAGNALTYTIAVTNNGPSNASSASLTVPLPASLTFTSMTPPPGWSCAATSCTTTAPFAAGTTATFTLVTQVSNTAAAGSTISTTATATSSSDTIPGNNAATATTTVRSPATLSGTKTTSGPHFETGSVTYTIVVTNSGPSAQSDNPGNELVDVLPASLTPVSASATSGSATIAANTVAWNGSIPAGSSVTITIVATIHAGTAGTPISNSATINFDADGNGTNESAATAGPAVFTPLPAAQIPALSPIALLAMALALVAVAALQK